MPRVKRQARSADELLAALLAFRDEAGRWPTATELEPSILSARGHDVELDRWHRLDLPHAGSLRYRFGSFDNAIVAAETALRARRRPARATRRAGKG